MLTDTKTTKAIRQQATRIDDLNASRVHFLPTSLTKVWDNKTLPWRSVLEPLNDVAKATVLRAIDAELEDAVETLQNLIAEPPAENS